MIELRDLHPEDEARLFAWRCEPEIGRWMSDADISGREAHRSWFDRLRSDPDLRGWMIERTGQPAGLLTLTGLSGHHRRAAWNWFIGDREARGRGAGRAAQVLGLDRAFGDLGLHKVWAEVMADNDAAMKVQIAAGFRREGYLRGHVLKDGAPRDVVMLGILAEEWAVLAPKARLELVESGLIAG
ncbi:MAG: UDP-4-amino-4,6-dideoxy-N-acetyl-beta-L-altrosamine N-acetyltransferase [Caulobacter sp.]|nr:UDP-4-amino-4,6-dideoxy-N-acetyl-beta-L-altrosamine N-acetyltransferase [Caulobacter sp.]